MLHTKYICFSAFGLGQNVLWRFYYIFLLKTADPRGVVNIDPRGMIRAILLELH